MSISLGTIKATITADTSRFEKGMKRSSVSLKQVGVAVAATGAAVVAMGKAFFDQVAAVAEVGDTAAKTSQQIGTTAVAYQELTHAAELSGASQSTLQAAMRRLGRSAEEARRGVGEYKEAWDTVGVSVTDSSGSLKDTDQLLMELSDTFQTLESETQKVALAQEFFGRSGTKLLPMLNQGSAGIGEMRAEANRLGIVLGETTTRQAEIFNDTITRMKGVITGTKNQAFTPFIAEVDKLAVAAAETMPVLGRTGQVVLVLGGALGESMRSLEVITNMFVAFIGVIEIVVGLFALLTGNTEILAKGWDDLSMAVGDTVDTVTDFGSRAKKGWQAGNELYSTSLDMAGGFRDVAKTAEGALDGLEAMEDGAKRTTQTFGELIKKGGQIGGMSIMGSQELDEAAKGVAKEQQAKSQLRVLRLQAKAMQEQNEVRARQIDLAAEIERISQSEVDTRVRGQKILIARLRAEQEIRSIKARQVDEEMRLIEKQAEAHAQAQEFQGIAQIDPADVGFGQNIAVEHNLGMAMTPQEMRQEDVKAKKKTLALTNQTIDATRQVAGAMGQALGFGEAFNQTLNASASIAQTVGGILQGTTTALMGGIGIAATAITTVMGLFGSSGGGSSVASERLSVREMGRIMGEEVASKLEDSDALRPIFLTDERGRRRAGGRDQSTFDQTLIEMGRRS